MKKVYEMPQIEMESVVVEQGIATSGQVLRYGNPGYAGDEGELNVYGYGDL